MRYLTLFLLLLVATIAGAQDAADPEPTAFMRALSLIPDNVSVREATPLFSYADYHSAIEARGLLPPPNWAAFESSPVDGPILFGLPPAGPSNMLQTLRVSGPEYVALLGFDFFDIAQAVEFGVPPSYGQILIGDFDADAVVAAYTARGYVAERETDHGTLLCPEAGCDTGKEMNLRERNPANPFGGQFGRSEPAYIGDGVFLNSPDFEVLESMIAVYEGDARSLAEMPEFQALADSLAAYPFVSAVVAVNPVDIAAVDVAALIEDPAIAEELMEGLEREPLPPYSMAAFASASDDAAEYGLAYAFYASAETAASAAAVMDSRMSANSMRFNAPYAEVYNAAGTLEPAQVVADEGTGLHLVVVRIAGEVPPNEEVEGQLIMSHRPFSRFLQGVYTRDTLWLVWDLAE